MSHSDARDVISREPMSRFQVVAVGLLLMLTALDGFDVLAITFAAPGISSEWGVSRAALGVVISSGLAGMILGSLMLAPGADVVGRRPIILLSLLLMSAGMFASAFSANIYTLAAWRVLTGLGIGGMLATVGPMAAEYSNHRWRNLSIALVTIGYPIGVMLGGGAAAWLLQEFSWRAVFLFGGLAASVLVPVVLRWMPESISFLINTRPPNALGRVNVIMGKMGHSAVATLPPSGQVTSTAMRRISALSRKLRVQIFCITAAYFLHMLTFYYFMGWAPQIVADLGFSASTAASVSVAASVGGILGGLVFGFVVPVAKASKGVIAMMMIAASSVALFGSVPPHLPTLYALAFFIGIGIFTAVTGIYALAAETFPTEVRATGTGLVLGLGRFGGVLAPVVAGMLFSTGLGLEAVSLWMALGSVAAIIMLLGMIVSNRANLDLEDAHV